MVEKQVDVRKSITALNGQLTKIHGWLASLGVKKLPKLAELVKKEQLHRLVFFSFPSLSYLFLVSLH